MSVFLLGMAWGIGCDTSAEVAPASEPSVERGQGKADGPLEGSCFEAETPQCDGASVWGNCWCDPLCAAFGDCCDDHSVACGGGVVPGPAAPLCLSDEECAAGETCDFSECLSCGVGVICPAVCFGQCLEVDDACPPQAQQAPCPGYGACEVPSGYDSVSASDLFAAAATFDGQWIALEGVLVVGPPGCTKIGCSDENPCCNACMSAFSLATTSGDLGLQGLGCSGDECNPVQSCDASPGAHATVWGRVEHHAGDIIELQVHGHCE